MGGPAAYGFARWIEQQAQGRHISNLLFVARDGYTLQKVFDTFDNQNIQTNYVYALRFLNNICCLNYVPTSTSQMQTILQFFQTNICAELPTKKMTKKQMHQFIQNHLSMWAPAAQQQLKQYRDYLSSYYKPDQLIGVVDSVTSNFSAQNLIENAVGKEKVTGYYWAVVHSPIAAQYRFESFLPAPNKHQRSDTFTHCWPFMEFLFTAPQAPIKRVTPQGEPLYNHPIANEEQARMDAYQQVSQGMLEFAQEAKHIFGGKNIFLTGDFLVQWVNWFLLHPCREDKKEMAHIFHASGSDHKEYEPLLSFRPSLVFMLTHIKKYIAFAKQVYWKTPFQFCLTCLLSPLACREISTYEKVFYFFPRLRKQYFRTGYSIGRYTITLIWGRRGD